MLEWQAAGGVPKMNGEKDGNILTRGPGGENQGDKTPALDRAPPIRNRSKAATAIWNL